MLPELRGDSDPGSEGQSHPNHISDMSTAQGEEEVSWSCGQVQGGGSVLLPARSPPGLELSQKVPWLVTSIPVQLLYLHHFLSFITCLGVKAGTCCG